MRLTFDGDGKMNLEEAIEAHASWKSKLAACLKRQADCLRAAEIRAANRSELGQWLHGEGMKFSSLAEYNTLVREHARFHRAAARIVEKAVARPGAVGDADLIGDSEFASASQNVVAAITALRKKVSSGRPGH
jgi:hypothetical protein